MHQTSLTSILRSLGVAALLVPAFLAPVACSSDDDADGTLADGKASTGTGGQAEPGGTGGDTVVGSATPGECEIADVSAAPDFLKTVGCEEDFEALASEPLDASIPGARSMKIVVDMDYGDEVYYQNSQKYLIHFEFAEEHLSVGANLAPIGTLAEFNEVQYTTNLRRFVLGAVTHYEGPDVWAFELSPYDTASAEMIELAFTQVAAHGFFGSVLRFHPTSEAIETVAAALPASVPIVTTEEIVGGNDYQPLNLAESYGKLVFITAEELETQFLTFRDIAVLDRVPNDISVTSGIITSDYQTPLAHINVLSQNRGTPNMAFRGAYDSDDFKKFKDKWVRLEVGAFDYELEEVTKEEADAWWENNKPAAVQVPGADTSVTDLRDMSEALVIDDPKDGPALLATIKEATRAFGGKAANFAALTHVEGLPYPKAFGVPIHYYFQFMEENGFLAEVDEFLADPEFQESAEIRFARLEKLRDDMKGAPVNAEFEQLLLDKIAADYPVGQRIRFRSSTNAEDLDGFTGAGLYTSLSGNPNDANYPVLDAVRKVWASVWFFRAFEERSFRSIEHSAVGMALLCHRSFPEEEANGVALTDNPFNKSGLEPAFYVNVQYGGASVVLPDPDVKTDSFLYFYGQEGQPTKYLTNSSLVNEGVNVLTRAQVHELGVQLENLRSFFAPAYGPGAGSTDWWAMDVEFKFDGERGEEPALFIKQARPFGNR